jgi:Tol biopolymer transport system component
MTNGGQRRVGLVVSIVGLACMVSWLSVQATEVVVFSYDTPGVPHYHDIYVMNTDGTALTPITQSSVDKDGYPTLSPDGWVAFARFNDSNAWKGDIYKIKLDGTSLTNLTNSPGIDDWAPNWSSDGSKIVYVSGDYDIYIMNSDGNNPINLTSTPDVSEYRPSLSPDGTEIIYIAHSASECDIVRMDTDGTGTINLTNTPELYEGITSVPWDVGWPNTSQLAWAPNGSKIAYTSWNPATDNCDIYVMNNDGSDQTLLIPDQGAEFDPLWLHDNKDGDLEV